ncbi:hypothetical protein BGX28_002757 [Mortierella sp. GBA30]|nr:hypothetical protein BGX28_002757 [Mortierella sp. GBA30]
MHRIHPQLSKHCVQPRTPLVSSKVGQEPGTRRWITVSDLHKQQHVSEYTDHAESSSNARVPGGTNESSNLFNSGTGASFWLKNPDIHQQDDNNINDPAQAGDADIGAEGRKSPSDVDDSVDNKSKKHRIGESQKRSRRSLKRHQKSMQEHVNMVQSQKLTSNLRTPSLRKDNNNASLDMDDPWLLSDVIDQELRSRSPTPVDDHASSKLVIAAVKTISKSPSMVSDTPHALDKADEFFVDSPAFSLPPPVLQIGHDQTNVNLVEELPRVVDPQINSPSANMDATVDRVSAGSNTSCVNLVHDFSGQIQQGLEVRHQDTSTSHNYSLLHRSKHQRHDNPLLSKPLFDTPATMDKFVERLDELRAAFHSALDSMMETIRGVDSLRSSTKTTLLERQTALSDEGKRIDLQVQGIRREASVLHSNAKSGLSIEKHAPALP